MQTKSAKLLLSRFLSFTETEVLGAFASLARAQKHPEFIYIPGIRDDRILLVAHADTVNDSKYSPKIRWMGDIATLESFWRTKHENTNVYNSHTNAYASSWSRSSLGGDDRCGCAMLWALQNLGHSLLITTGEESGLKGANAAVKEIKVELARHAYALEVDRRGDRQAVFYDVSTEAFEDYILKALTKSDPEDVEWVQELGSSTDIRAICPAVSICGVNVSAGYINEHSGTEAVFAEAWLHTHGALLKMLKPLQQAFALPKPKVTVVKHIESHFKWCYIHGCWRDKCPASFNERCEQVIWEKSHKPATGPFKLQVFRTGGTEAGAGGVDLRAVGVDGKSCALGKISKRQCKKFGKYISGMITKGALNNAEASQLLALAIQLRDGPIPTVTAAQREEHSAGGIEAFVAGIRDTKPNGAHVERSKFYNRGGEFVPHPVLTLTGPGRCWHRCGKCDKPWFHERFEGAEDRPSFFCFCPVCSPNVVPRLIAVKDHTPAAWGYGLPGEAPAIVQGAPSGQHNTAVRVSVVGAPPSKPLNENTVCQHYCSRCQAPWRHVAPPVTRAGGVLCGVGGYDHDCPLHSAHAAKKVLFIEKDLKITAGWTATLHTPPPEEPASVSGPHDAALPTREDVLPLGD